MNTVDPNIIREMAKATSWSEAKRLGLTVYFTGRPCKRGHLSNRCAANGVCFSCQKQARKPEWGKKSSAKWRTENREYNKSRKAEWGQRTKPARLAAVKAYRDKNPEWVRAQNQKRHAARIGTSGCFTADDVKTLYKRQSGCCALSWCRKNLGAKYHIDHIKPLSRGGSNDRKNIQLLCPFCNLRKHAADPIEHAQRHGMLL